MHIQNIKTAASESTGRWGSDPKIRFFCVIAEQKSYLNELCGVWNLQLDEQNEAEEILRILCAMSENILKEGVLDWSLAKPLVSLPVVQPWLQARAHTVRQYGETGAAAWECSRKDIADSMIFDRAMMQMESY